MTDKFKVCMDELIEKHLGTGFLDFNFLTTIRDAIVNRKEIGRKELLLISYLIGANAEESNRLIEAIGYEPLYVKRREDAIWWFVLNHRVDGKKIIDEIFPQNEDEKKGKEHYNKGVIKRKEEEQ